MKDLYDALCDLVQLFERRSIPLANRPRDRIDVDDLFFSLGQLDTKYMRKWALQIGVADRLDEALNRHGNV